MLSVWQNQVITALHKSIAPAANMYPANPAIASELWELLSTLPYTGRFFVYAKLTVCPLHSTPAHSCLSSRSRIPLFHCVRTVFRRFTCRCFLNAETLQRHARRLPVRRIPS